ncbi:hypothetical protein [Pararhodospirillum oryzae]|uniref:Uncharacterized protein n=1 Tax=Pararhodospirillum oryzae TaxID=478448 RepID=A0A512H4A7_9PROT|nr:hypothetical protein [Pararhodospirillum oryzae]GEO80263.1 hypothetical protein ROR02_03940 [Pararhodospirillum oryzae]
MPIMPTSYHALNLFTLTMETRFGSTWQADMEPSAVAALAEEVARGFGGRRIAQPQDGSSSTVWCFPDDSIVRTSPHGLEMETPADALALHVRVAAS